MANKRMFTMKICDSDAFLDMPLSTQCLYFHLNMRADDDGFIDNAKRILRLIGASDDDLKLLVAKRFIIPFEDGVMVIKHWRMHNTLSKQRYHETQYLDEKAMLKVKENGSYSLNDGKPIDDTKLIESSTRQVRRTIDEQAENADLDIDLDIDIDLDSEQDLVKEEKKTKDKKTPVYYPADEKLNQAFADYVEMRKKIKKPMTDKAIELAMNKLKGMAKHPIDGGMDNDVAIKILEQSVLNSWQGLFPLKQENENQNENKFVDMWRNA